MTTDTKEQKTAFELAEDALRKFWREKSKTTIIKAKHTEIVVEPKIFMGGHINPEVGKLLIKEYLSNLSPEDIAKGRVVITADMIMITDDNGELIAEVRSKKLINSMINKITNFLGRSLSAKVKTDGQPYVEPRENGAYCFGDIKDALVSFLTDKQKTDSKNIVRDAIILIKRQ
jgi:hypothetical protein